MKRSYFFIFSIICLVTILMNVLISLIFTLDFFGILKDRKEALYSLYEFENYLSQIVDAETGQRGFIITGNNQFLEPYEQALLFLQSSSTKNFVTRELENSEEFYTEKMKEIKELQELKFSELAKTIEIRKNGGFEEAQKRINQGYGKEVMDKIRKIFDSLIQKKQQDIELMDISVQNSMNKTIQILLFTNSIAGLLFLFSLFSIYRSIKQMEKKDKQLSETLDQLNESLATTEAIVNSANHAIIAVNPEGTIISFNPAAEQMLGYQKDELLYKQNPSIFHDSQEIEARAIALSKKYKTKIQPGFEVFVFLAKQDIADTNEWTYIRKDGSRFPISLSVTPVKNTHGEITGYMGIANDVTERKELDRMKNELISITSYELRSPIAAIKGAIDLLSQQELEFSDQIKRILEIGKKNCLRLVKLTEDIIDLQKIESGKVKFNLKNFNISEFLTHVVESNQYIAKEANVSLEYVNVSPELNIDADEDRLMQVMNNLISNAIKYSPETGKVLISARKVNSRIRFEIHDQGPGIPEEFKSKIFQRFARDTSPANLGKKGMGLGLSIAKSIVEKHRGTINFIVNPEGTTFWFEIPISEIKDHE